MAASFIRSVNVGQDDPDTKEFTRISISGAKLLKNIDIRKNLEKTLYEHETESRDN